MSVTQQPHRPT